MQRVEEFFNEHGTNFNRACTALSLTKEEVINKYIEVLKRRTKEMLKESDTFYHKYMCSIPEEKIKGIFKIQRIVVNTNRACIDYITKENEKYIRGTISHICLCNPLDTHTHCSSLLKHFIFLYLDHMYQAIEYNNQFKNELIEHMAHNTANTTADEPIDNTGDVMENVTEHAVEHDVEDVTERNMNNCVENTAENEQEHIYYVHTRRSKEKIDNAEMIRLFEQKEYLREEDNRLFNTILRSTRIAAGNT
ncbi:hypothetical protein NEFER03_0420 [Nematocida sp. LUAm3]|nr:hypothetical protein NEFER03_0420 [Nematocida sp. LUAm3]KAI5175878.1 hypothetical protein NEFER02_1738 [Nematocida sp. LUAm2]KAI5178740.1 hypothetical protein NEFER01_1859 [Nematocida sp. LUAm1]